MSDGPKDELFRRFRRMDDGMSVIADNGHGDNLERNWRGPDFLVHRTVVARWTATTMRLISRASVVDGGEEENVSDLRFIRVTTCRRYVMRQGTTVEETDVIPDKHLVDCFGCMH